MIMISAERLPLEHVEGFVRERFLARVAVEAVAVVFAFELPVGGGDGLFFDGEVAASALREWGEVREGFRF